MCGLHANESEIWSNNFGYSHMQPGLVVSGPFQSRAFFRLLMRAVSTATGASANRRLTAYFEVVLVAVVDFSLVDKFVCRVRTESIPINLLVHRQICYGVCQREFHGMVAGCCAENKFIWDAGWKCFLARKEYLTPRNNLNSKIHGHKTEKKTTKFRWDKNHIGKRENGKQQKFGLIGKC